MTYQWVAAPICGIYEHGTRWRLEQDGIEVGRVVQLMPGGLWEAHSEEWYSPGHDRPQAAAAKVWEHVTGGAKVTQS